MSATSDNEASELRRRAAHPGALHPILEDAEETHRGDLEDRRLRHVDYYAVGRLLVASLFLVSGLIKLLNFDATIQSLMNAGVQDAALVIPIALVFELIGGSMLALGYWTRTAAAVLITYLAIVTTVVNWDLRIAVNQEHALYNLALVGALFMVLAYGGGGFSLDKLRACRAHRAQVRAHLH